MAVKIPNITEVDQHQIEQLLYKEAYILDQWKLDDWLTMLTKDAGYYVPSNDIPNGDHKQHLFLIADDNARLKARVKRLKSPFAHVENPHSNTKRIISNVLILERDDDKIVVTSNFVVYRYRINEKSAAFVGHYEHTLTIEDGELKIANRRAVLASEEIGSLGTVSMIL